MTNLTRKKSKNIFSNHNGASVVSVIVVTALIGLFVSSVMFVSLYNRQIRAAEQMTQDNFYTADLAMEEIRVGLTKYTSDAMAAANLEVLEKYTANASIEQTRTEFSTRFLDKLTQELGGNKNATRYQTNVLSDMTSIGEPKLKIRAQDAIGNTLYRAKDDSSLTLRGVEIEYTDNSGYVSVLSTDITISVPTYGFATDPNLPDLARFALIGQRGIVIEGRNVSVLGTSIFAGKGNGESDNNGVGLVLQNASLNLVNCPYIVSESKVDIANTGGNDMQGKADLSMSTGSSLWAEDVNVYGKGSSLALNGISYVNDDLTVYGKGNQVTLGGQYFGYGRNDNSAIIVNGTNTKLDMNELNTLVLTGNASIGVNATAYGGEPGSVTKQVAMGESLAAKGGQLAYLAPPEMVGVTGEGATLGVNPMPYNTYTDFLAEIAKANAHWIDVDRALPNMGGKTLRNYNVTSGNSVYVYHDQDSGYVYVYLRFADEKTAGRFFRDYYDANYASMTAYIGKYIDISELSINPDLFDSSKMGEFRVDVAGNIITASDTFKYNADMQTFDIKDGYNFGDRKIESEAITAAREKELREYAATFRSLCHKLTTAQITEEEADKTVFENYLNASKINTLRKITSNGIQGVGVGFDYKFVEKNEDGTIVKEEEKTVAWINFRTDQLGNNGKPLNSVTVSDFKNNAKNDIRIIITTGDVYVDEDFDGIILANGTIRVKGGKTVTNTRTDLSELLRATAEINGIPDDEKTGTGNTFQLAELFNEDDNWMPVVGNSEKPDDADLNPLDMISFSNWKRN